jgi:hypothetical protein
MLLRHPPRIRWNQNMNTPRVLVATAAVVALATANAPASAQDLSSSADVVRGSVNHHAYQNGGASKEQVADMTHHMKPYDLRLTFSEGKHNAYVADVKLHIIDAAGKKVFALESAGPMTDVKLPAGQYRVVADFGGVKRSGSVDVKPGEPASFYLHWPKDEI